MLPNIVAVLGFVLGLGGRVSVASSDLLAWKSTTETAVWFDQPAIPGVKIDSSSSLAAIAVDPKTKFQTIEGWGGCFNERGWKAMERLDPPDRDRVLRSMFDARAGLKLNLCRTPIAASDYAIDLYSYDETPGDFALSHFSMDRDRQRLIPYIKAAMAIQPDLKIWAVPWSPPSWMKDSGKLTGGHIKTDPETMNALAHYFIKYVRAYRAEGIDLYMVMPQNEPCYSNGYTSCLWTGREMAIFVRDYLGPAFKADHLDCQIYLGTFPRSDPKKYDYDYWVAPALTDPAAAKYITGVGCQWSGDKVMADVRDRNPGVKLMQTEAECGKTNTNDWKFANDRFKQILTYMEAGAQSYMIWNLVLDETGKSTDNWAQCSPIVIDQKTAAITFTPYFYMFEHFSSFVKPGAIRIATSLNKGGPSRLAFLNPDGLLVVVLSNSLMKETQVMLQIGDYQFQAALPARSFSTFTLQMAL